MNFDDIFQEIGEFGWYQGIVIFIIYLPGLFLPMLNMGYIFLSAIPNYRCYVDGCDNSTTEYHEQFLNFTTPFDSSIDDFSQCQLHSVYQNFTNYNSNETCNSDQFDSYATIKCGYWKYDDSIFKSTVVTKWDLVCDDSNLVALSQSIYMMGNMIGGMIVGIFGDIYGRKMMLMFCIFFNCVFGTVSAFAPNYPFYVAVRFFLGASSQGAYISILVLSVELVGKKQRGHSGMLMCVVYAIGEVIFGGLAYAIRDWQWLQLVISAPFALFLIYFWIIPDSPRWMLLNGHVKSACKVFKKIAKSNKKEFPEHIIHDFRPEVTRQDDNVSENKSKEKASWLDLFRTSYMRVITINMCFNWFMITVSYYGITMSAPSLGGDQFVNFIIISSIEVPAYLFGMFAMDKIGRRFSICFCMVLGGVAGVCTAIVPTTSDYLWLSLLLATIGKFGATSAFGIIYVYTAELYPTVLRNNGIAFNSFVGHIGGVIAPYLATLESINPALPLVIIGICSLASGLMSFTLPETLGRQLPETIEDCKNTKTCGCRSRTSTSKDNQDNTAKQSNSQS